MKIRKGVKKIRFLDFSSISPLFFLLVSNAHSSLGISFPSYTLSSTFPLPLPRGFWQSFFPNSHAITLPNNLHSFCHLRDSIFKSIRCLMMEFPTFSSLNTWQDRRIASIQMAFSRFPSVSFHIQVSPPYSAVLYIRV